MGYENRVRKNAEAAISDDLKALDEKLKAARRAKEGETQKREEAHGHGAGLRLGLEFVSGILAGALLGWLVDHFFHTTPFGLVIFMLLGFATGLRNAVREAKKIGEAADKETSLDRSQE